MIPKDIMPIINGVQLNYNQYDAWNTMDLYGKGRYICPYSFSMPWQSFEFLYKKGWCKKRLNQDKKHVEYKLK